jgi:PAS domain S-box-containing protein
MKDQSRTKQALIQELTSLRERIAELEQSESERKRVGNTLIQSEKKYRTLIENIHDGIYILDSFGNFTFVNDVIVKRSGFPTEWFLGRSYLDVISEKDREHVQSSFNEVMDGKTQIYDLSYPTKSGDLLHVEVCTAPLFDDAKVIGLLGISRDIKKRKQAEDEKQKQLIRTIVLDNASLVLANVTLDYEGALQSIAQYLSEMIGDACTVNLLTEDGQFIYTVAAHHPDPDTSAHILKIMSSSPYGISNGLMGNVARGNKPLLITDTPQDQIRAAMKPELYPYMDRPGLYSMLMVPMHAQGKVVGTIGLTRDNPEKSYTLEDQTLLQELADRAALTIINARLYFEKMKNHAHLENLMDSLRRAEENFRCSLEDSPLGVRIVTGDGETIYANRAILDIYGYDSFEELKTTPIEMRYTPESFAEHQIRKEKRKRGENAPSKYEIRIIRKDGKIRHLQAFRKEILWDGERQFQVLYNDITERKLAEEKIQSSLREKEMLLGEVHHRVKNNLQVISGLLDLQARSSGNPELSELLNESQSRIRSMAMVHEKLYGSKDFTRINLAGYVRTLSQELLQSYKINPGEIDLIFQTDGDVYVDINKAIPCGLILNELISNALRHAFPGDEPGEIKIIIGETKNKDIEIVVRDNGMGLPDDVDIHQPRTVGLYLVNGLVKNQLDGLIEGIRDGGTGFRIKFPL